MPKTKVNDVVIEYDHFGDPSSEPLLLIMGLGTQMIGWDPEFCEMLVEKGFYVIRFDNRDVGLSTKFDDAGIPNIMKMIQKRLRGKKVESPYSLEDMADDAMGVLDTLGIEKAHICGASMGGMIAQVITLRYPERVLSLTSIMSTTGNPELPQAKPKAMKVLSTPPPTNKEDYIEYSLKNWKVLQGSGFPPDEERIRKRAADAFDRCFYPQGTARQLAAIFANGNRKQKLKEVEVPTLIIHGTDDPLVPFEGGKDTAEAIPGAELILIEGMGHYLPPGAWERIVNAISKNASKAK